MKRRKIAAGLVGIAGLVSLVLTSATVLSQRPPLDAPLIKIPERDVLRLKPKVPFSARFEVTDFDAASKPEILNRSMTTRRQVAWEVVRRVWAHIPVAEGTYIPVWTTWYEREDIARLYEDMLRRKRASSKAEAVAEVNAALRRNAVKDLGASLRSERLGKTLRQFTFPESRDLGPHRTPGTGSIYYSPAYVKHFLENAERIARCDPNAFPKPSSKSLRPGSLTDIRPILDIDSVPARLRPSDPKNFYALCMDHEMPRDAVMIKTAWYPVQRTRRVPPLTRPPTDRDRREDVWIPGQHLFQLDATMAAPLNAPPAGQWIKKPYRWPSGASMIPPGEHWSGQFLVTDETGREWSLLGMHIATKIVRNWLWISMFWNDGWAWTGEKRPMPDWFHGPILTGSFYPYGMCVASDFTEGDPRPWAAYLGAPGLESAPERAETFRAIAGVMKGAQWCSNPYIETNMARGNCIGCHQGSPDSFLPTTLTKQRGFNISDFSFSFETNRASIIEIRRRHGL